MVRRPHVSARIGVPWGFTLIEVVLAFGLVAFVLTAILGLASLATSGTKTADLNARLAAITERVVAEYQGRPFSSALTGLPTNSFFDFSGAPSTNASEIYFRCDIRQITNAGASTNYAVLDLMIRWPTPHLTSTNETLFSVFNYQ